MERWLCGVVEGKRIVNGSELRSGATTVIHLASFFEELKASAVAEAAQSAAQERGYFAPEEELRMRALQLSYWKSRGALLELIAECRADVQRDREYSPKVFLVAMSAAMLLVDAARWLREHFHDRPVVRRKFNEAAPEFGIPAGTYDQVQQSLVGIRHAWHLFHALCYLDENEAALEEFATDEPYRQLFSIIRHHRERLDVPIAQFAKARVRMRSRRVVKGVAGGLLNRAIYGLQKLGMGMMSNVFVRPGHSPQMPTDVVQRVEKLLQPGDVLIVRKEFALTNYFLPGYWPHVALFLGSTGQLTHLGLAEDACFQRHWHQITDNSWSVLESMKDGVLVRSLENPLRSDSLVVLRPRLDPALIADGLTRGILHEGKPYDFDFDFARSDRLVCTEVVYRGFDGLGTIDLRLTKRAGRLTLSGSDLIQMAINGQQFDTVMVYAPGLGESTVIEGNATKAVLQRGMEK